MKQLRHYLAILFLLVFSAGLWIPRLEYHSESSRLSDDLVLSGKFRSQPVPEEILDQIKGKQNPGELLGIYWLESGFGQEKGPLSLKEAADRRKRWERADGWSEYLLACQAVWDDLVYFPVAEFPDSSGLRVSFENSWMFERSYGGERAHEGTDIMPSVNENGVFPVISMTDGVIENKGWLELGGWRLGIRAPHGAYFYYAHLDSYAEIEVGDQVKAGDLLGFMGDTGYGTTEGTRGKFPVHLHLGIYLIHNGKEVSVNPYAPLRYVEEKKIQGFMQ